MPREKFENRVCMNRMRLEAFRSRVDDTDAYLLFLLLREGREPFMNPGLARMIRFGADRGIPSLTGTNCPFLEDRDSLAEILRSGPATPILAVDSISGASHDRYREGGEVVKLVAGVLRVVALQHKIDSLTKVHLRMVVLRQNGDDRSAPGVLRGIGGWT